MSRRNLPYARVNSRTRPRHECQPQPYCCSLYDCHSPFCFEYTSVMPQSLAQVWIHIVFSIKERKPLLRNSDIREEMFRFLAYQVTATGCVSASVGGHVDHVHMLVGLSRTVTISKLVGVTKSESSRWMKGKLHDGEWAHWQSGYGAFSVSHSLLDVVDEYIRNQEAHHATMSFQTEYRQLCQRHGIKIDERYVWD